MFYDAGEKPSAERVSPPGKAEKAVPAFAPSSLIETKTRLNVSANKIYKKSLRMDF